MPAPEAWPAHQKRYVPGVEGLEEPPRPNLVLLAVGALVRQKKKAVYLVCRIRVIAKVEFLHICVLSLSLGPASRSTVWERVQWEQGAHICLCSKPRAAFIGTREEAGNIGSWQHKLHPAGTRYSPFGSHFLVLL